jgi:biotin operon repressor
MTRQRLDLARRRSEQAGAAAAAPLHQLDIARMLEHPAPGIEWLWNGYLELGTVAQLHGDGGAGKSLLAGALVRASAGGHSLLGRDTWPSRWVVIDGENPRSEIHRRLERLDYREVADKVAYFPADDVILGDLAQAELLLAGLIEQHRADGVVLDSQRALWPGEENEANAVRRLYAMLGRVANQTACAILVLHHDRRAGGYSGSSDLNAAVDSRLHLIAQADGTVELRHEKLRSDVARPPVRYRLHLEHDRYALAVEEVPATELERVAAALTDDPQIASEIAREVGSRRQDVEKLLEQLKRTGRAIFVVGPPGRRSNARCWTLPVPSRDRLGQAADREPGDTPSTAVHTPVGGEGGTGIRRLPVPSSDTHDQAEIDRLLDKHADIAQGLANGGR